MVNRMFLVFVAIMFLPLSLLGEIGVTYSFTYGRTGDHITAYIESRWIAYSKGIPFYYRPFKYSDLLEMDTLHRSYENHCLREVPLKDAKDIDMQAENTLFVMSPFPLNNNIQWDDHGFVTCLRNEIRPKKLDTQITIPQGALSVAIHIRRGGGFDAPLWQEGALTNFQLPAETYAIPEEEYQDKLFPLKTPPDIWYIQMLRYIRKLHPGRPMYVFIFTDDPKPEIFADMYAKALNDPLVTFDYRASNSHDTNVLEDFFAMMQFDCVVRAASWFSSMACLIGRPKIEIRASDYRWEGRKLIITEIMVRRRHDTEEECKTKHEYLSEW